MSTLEKIKTIIQRSLIDGTLLDGEVLDDVIDTLEGLNTDVTIDTVNPIITSKYIRPKRIKYHEKGINKTWDVIGAHDSVSVVVYNVTTRKFVFVKMFRPAVWNAGGTGYVLDLCAGLVDKDKSLVQIAKEEVLEELGYDVPIEAFIKVNEIRNSVGLIGSKNTMFAVSVTSKHKVSNGGGIDDENIEVVEYTPMELEKALKYEEATMGVLYTQERFMR